MRSIDDVKGSRKATRAAFLTWVSDLGWQHPFSVTLTFKQAIQLDDRYVPLDQLEASKNVRYFLSILNRSALGRAAVRRGKRLTCVGSLEQDVGVRLHGHFCLNKPPHITDEQFHGLIITSWARTLFGHLEVDVKPCTDVSGWLSYIAKYRTKPVYSDAIDWMNVHSDRAV